MYRQRTFGNIRSGPAWLADAGPGNVVSIPLPGKLDPTQFTDMNGVVVQANGVAAIGATSITVDALSLPLLADNLAVQGAQTLIPRGTSLHFGAGKFAVLTADAKIGDTTISVLAIPTALADNDKAIYSPGGTLTLASGILLGRTYAERDANTPFGAAASTDDEFFIMMHEIPDVNAPGGDDCEVVRHQMTIKENYLPEWSTISANSALLTKLRATYRCIKGVD